MRKHAKIRSAKGQAIAEGAAFLVVFTMVAVAAVLFLLNVGVIMYNKQKVNFMAHCVALSYQDTLLWNNGWRQGVSEDQAEKYAKKMLDQLISTEGLDGDATLKIKRNSQVITATIEVKRLGLLGGGGIFPDFCSIKESAAVPLEKNQPYCLAKFKTSDGKIVCCPSYGYDVGNPSLGNGKFRQLGLETMALNGFPLPNSGIGITLPGGSAATPIAYDRKVFYPR